VACSLSSLMDNVKCFAFVRQHRWPDCLLCPTCDSSSVIRDECDDTQPHRQRYRCKACASRFNDLTGTILAGHHQPLHVWVMCLYFMELNLSNRQIAFELGLDGSDAPGTLVHTDEYAIYTRLPAWGYQHKTVCHGRGEYARDEDGDGFCEVHVNTIEGFWSLLRSWLRPHRGLSQDKLPLPLGFFQFVHSARRRGKALLGALIAGLVA